MAGFNKMKKDDYIPSKQLSTYAFILYFQIKINASDETFVSLKKYL